MEIVKKDTVFDGIIQSVENATLTAIEERNILTNASEDQLKTGRAKPVILAQQIDWSGLTTTIGNAPIIMNTSQDVIGYLAGALEFVYNMTGDIQHTVYSYSGYFSKIIQTAYEIKNIVSDNTTYKLAYIDITYDMIKNYVQNTNSYYSQIVQTAYDITSLVYAYGYAFSMIQQNAYSINTFVSNYDSSYWSKWTQTAYGFESLAYDYKGNSSRWNQTADGFETYVKEYTGDFSRFKQTADMFETHVESYLGDFSTIRQTADRIESIVMSYGKSWSTIEQTAYDIKASVKNEVSGYLAELNISPESIKASIQGEVAYQVSYIEITPDQITQAVENSESIASLKTRADSIEASVRNLETGYQTAIRQTADELRLEADNSYKGLVSYISVTAGQIRQEVDDSYNGLVSYINQTASGILLAAQSYTYDMVSTLNISYDQIRAAVGNSDELAQLVITKAGISGIVDGYNGSYSRWNQTANDLTSIIADNSDAWSEWKQDKDSIQAVVNGYNNSFARWNISADGIEQKVNTAYNTLFTYFIQKTDSILLSANNYADDKFANIEVTPEQIKSAVQGDSSFAQQVITDSGIESRIETAKGDITTLQTTVGNITGKVSTLENVTSDVVHKSTIDELNSRLTQYTTYSYIKSSVFDVLDNKIELQSSEFVKKSQLSTDLREVILTYAGYVYSYDYQTLLNDSYANIDINGYLNTFVDLGIVKNLEITFQGEYVNSAKYSVQNADVFVYLPDNILSDSTDNYYKINFTETITDDTPDNIQLWSKYVGSKQFKNINRAAAKGNLKIDINIPNT